MSPARTYLDHNATSPMRPEVRDVMVEALGCNGNPSSVHEEGRRARGLIEGARKSVAQLVGAAPKEVIFTSGGTEANNMVLRQSWDAVVTTATEHDSVLSPAMACGAKHAILKVDKNGLADPDHLAELLTDLCRENSNVLVSVQMANNETGVLQDLGKISAIINQFREDNPPEAGDVGDIVLHTDAVQAAGKIPVDFVATGADAMSLSAHKIGGPKGVGALIKRPELELAPLMTGGGQEGRNRAGTENTAAIAGFGKAAGLALAGLGRIAEISRLRDRLEGDIARLAAEAEFIAHDAPRLPNTSAIALPGHAAETLVIAFDLAGCAISAGAACTSGKVARSRVLEAMGLDDSLTGAAIRVSLGWDSNDAHIDNFIKAARDILSGQSDKVTDTDTDTNTNTNTNTNRAA